MEKQRENIYRVRKVEMQEEKTWQPVPIMVFYSLNMVYPEALVLHRISCGDKLHGIVSFQ